MPNVIPIRRATILSKIDEEVVEFAYNRWLERGFRGGSPAEDLLIAVSEVNVNTSSELFLVPKRNAIQAGPKPLLAMRRGLKGR